MQKKILVPVDGSDVSFRALDFAMRVGKLNDSEIIVIHVDIPYDLSRLTPKRPPDDVTEIDPLAAKATALDFAKRKATVVGYTSISFKELIACDAADRICEEAEKLKADLVVMGCRSHGVLLGVMLGSVCMKVVQNIQCPITIIK